jgi:hypothetical protein
MRGRPQIPAGPVFWFRSGARAAFCEILP